MTPAGDSAAAGTRSELRVVGTRIAHEVDALLDLVAGSEGRRAPRVLQIGSRSRMADRNVLNWRSRIDKRFGGRALFIGLDLQAGSNVDAVADICGAPRALRPALGRADFDLAICCHVLEHTRDPWRAARNIENLLRPGGLVFVSTAWSQAFDPSPDDYWRFSVRGLMRLFGRLRFVSSFYSGGDVGLDVAYRVMRNGEPEFDTSAGAVEQGLFQLVLDHEDNRSILAQQATERLPVSRTYLPTLFVNAIGRLED
jgi:SAM-dependent methyltransferase